MPVDVHVAIEAPTDGFGVEDPAALIEQAVRATLEDRDVQDAELSVVLLDDDGMAALNRRWKDRDGPTDVLAFPLHEPGDPPLGDIYLGGPSALRQAAELGEPPARELARIAVHAALHVLGWDHPEDEREGSEMWQHQERILESIGRP